MWMLIPWLLIDSADDDVAVDLVVDDSLAVDSAVVDSSNVDLAVDSSADD